MWQANIGRLMWKEYRVQRSAWLSLLAGTALLQGMVACSMEPGTLGSTAFVLALVLSACYAAACAGILFAGEREEETDLLLRQLPLRPGPLVAAKLLFALLVVAGFMGATLFNASVATNWARVSLEEAFRNEQPFLALLARAVVGVFVWGLLFSLLMRHVLAVVLCAGVMEVLVTGLVGEFGGDHRDRVYFAIVGAVGLVDLWLSLRWAAGDAVLPTPRLEFIAARAGRRRSGRWARWLSRGVQRGSPVARTCSALVWRELRTVLSFCVWWLPLGILLVDLVPRCVGIPTHTLFLIATPLVCGLLVCLSDQRRQTHRFLSERGVSAATVWSCKQAVWLLLALAVVGVFGAWDSLAVDRFRSSEYQFRPLAEEFRRTIHTPSMSTRSNPHDSPADRDLQWEFVWALGLSLYAVGQLASFWIRRSVLAFGAALVGAIAVGIWLMVLNGADVALICGAWPAVIAWGVGTFFLSGRWLRGDVRWRTRILQCAWVIVPVLGVLTASASYRSHQVPVVNPGLQWPLLEYQHDQFDSRWSQRWQELLAELRLRSALAATGGSATDFERAETLLLELGDELATPHGRIDPLLLRPGEPQGIGVIGTVLTAAAHRFEQQGNLSEAWRAYAAGLRVTSYLSQQCSTWDDWSTCAWACNRILDGIRQWASDPHQTSASLHQALAFLQDESGHAISAREMLSNRYVIYDQLLARRGRLSDEVRNDPGIRIGFCAGAYIEDFPLMCAQAPAFERERIRRLIDLATARTLAGGVDFDADEIARWAASTTLLPADFLTDLTDAPGTSPQDLVFKNMLANARGTAVVTALYAYRLDHGAFPADLSELAAESPMVSLRDPCDGGWLGYRSTGFPKPVLVAPDAILPAGQPMLWSTGTAGAAIVQAAETIGQAKPFQVSAGDYYATNIRYVQMQGDSAASEAAPNPDRVVFAILGFKCDPVIAPPTPEEVRGSPDADATVPADQGELR